MRTLARILGRFGILGALALFPVCASLVPWCYGAVVFGGVAYLPFIPILFVLPFLPLVTAGAALRRIDETPGAAAFRFVIAGAMTLGAWLVVRDRAGDAASAALLVGGSIHLAAAATCSAQRLCEA